MPIFEWRSSANCATGCAPWLNFTWYTSAYGNDDAIFRVATIVQMVGALLLVFGLPQSFHDAAAGASPINLLIAMGYLVMRLPLILLWLRAAREDLAHRKTANAYVVLICAAQLGWILALVASSPVVDVIGHELVGYKHTIRVVERQIRDAPAR